MIACSLDRPQVPQAVRHLEAAGISVFVVDDDDSVCRGLSRLLRAVGFRVQTFTSATDYLARPAFDGVGCLVLDVQMPDVTGPELHQRLESEGCFLPVVYLTAHADVPTSIDAMKYGAVDFLLKPVDDDVLVESVHRAAARCAAQRAREARIDDIRSRLARLSARELEVMMDVLRGRLNKQIAFELGISEKTVKVHRGRVMDKMKVRSVAMLVHLCEAAGIGPELD